jgi:transposase
VGRRGFASGCRRPVGRCRSPTRKAKAVGSLAAKTDKLDARVLAELARRDLVPRVQVPTFADRELKERLGRRMHMVRLRTAAINRAHGVLSQFGVRLAFDRLRAPDAEQLLAERGVPAVWRRSIAEAVAIVRVLDERLVPIELELRPLARADARVRLLVTIPGIGDLLGLTIASEIGDISRFASARKLVGYCGLTPRIYQSGQKSRTGKLSRTGSTMLRWARSRPPTRRGGRTIHGTSSTSTSRSAAAARATPPRPPSRARS